MHTQLAPVAQDIMNRHVHTVPPDMHLEEIVTFLLRRHISNAPVVAKEGDQQRLLGFVSEGDCLEFMGNELFYGSPSPPQTAETIMKRHPTCVSPETDIFALTSIFTSHRFRHLPVVADGNLIGIISRCDVLRALDKYYREWVDLKEHERFPVDVHQIMNHRFIVTG